MMPLFQKRRTPRRRLIYDPKVVKQPYPIEKCSDSNFLNQDDPYHVTRYSCVPKGTDKKMPFERFKSCTERRRVG